MNNKLEKVLSTLEAGKPKQALILVKKLNQNKKLRTYHSFLAEALCHIELGFIERGKELLDQYYFTAANPEALFSAANNIFRASVKSKKPLLAIPYLLYAIENLSTRQAIPLRYCLAKCYQESRDFQLAVEILKALLVYKDYTLKCLNRLTAIGIVLSDFDMVQKYLKLMHGYIDQLDLNNLKVLIDRSELHLDTNVEPLLNRAKNMGCEDNFISYMQARIEFKKNNPRLAMNKLESLNPDMFSSLNLKLGYFNLLGKVQLALKNVDASFSSFEKMNHFMASHFPDNWTSYNILPELKAIGPLVKRKLRYTQPIKLSFLIGFPRSGTTLLEHVLDSQKGIFALGEKYTIDAVIQKIVDDGFQYPSDLNNLSDAYVDELRELYFYHVEKYLGDKTFQDYQILLDKNPQLLMKLPILLTLFPDVKILLSIRHPLDCILSCFQQNFHYRRNLAYFTDWQLSFERYRDVFDNYMAYREVMQWQECRVHYDELTSDFAENVERSLEFLGIDVDKESYLNFNEQSKKTIITTPSINQVKQGIYHKKAFNWESHVKYIIPHWDKVRHHIEYFGYSTELIEKAIQEVE